MHHPLPTLILLLTLPLYGLCQNKFSFGGNGPNLEVSSMTITNSKAIGGIKDKGGIMGIGYSVGFQTQYAINQHLFLRSGFTYQSNGYRHIMENLLFPTDIINGTTSTIQNDLIVSSIGIPIDFGCLIPKRNRVLNRG